eukprot:GHVN01087196.1.p1 GENE.GHVN01087196.1~~GHVN01087196.1.p1  ORF type:complete len:251 (+),score=18.24 GHVN01087196.1:202-954(+)
MAKNFLKLNDDKTDFMIVGNNYFLSHVNCSRLTIGNVSVNPSSHVKNIGAVLDSTLSMNEEISAKCKSAWWQLYQLSKIKKFLSTNQLKSVVIALVLCRLDQNNALLQGLPTKSIERLQKVQNAAARLICSSGRFDDSAPLLISLHWLPITHRITFKILLFVFKCQKDMAPPYLSDLLIPYTCSYDTRLSDSNNLVKARTHNNWGDRCFAVAGPRLWEHLPLTIKNHSSVKSFKKALKTHLFKDAYKCEI